MKSGVRPVKDLLNELYERYNRKDFIALDPISIPHQFTKKQDIEIAALFAAVFAWGQRITIINKTNELLKLMDFAPHDFITTHQDADLKRFLGFKHRTFNDTDLLYFISFLKFWYAQYDSLETAFVSLNLHQETDIGNGLNQFKKHFFSLDDFPQRTMKHISSPQQGSSCKRLNMFLRWMVRKDKSGVDFGIWNQIKSSQLIIPLDVHSSRVARKFGLLKSEKNDWKAAVELTKQLRKFDKQDPVKYDFALFGAGVEHVY
ncbi:MAG: TIGR02757 family protein [Bacteroidia bacterium]